MACAVHAIVLVGTVDGRGYDGQQKRLRTVPYDSKHIYGIDQS